MAAELQTWNRISNCSNQVLPLGVKFAVKSSLSYWRIAEEVPKEIRSTSVDYTTEMSVMRVLTIMAFTLA